MVWVYVLASVFFVSLISLIGVFTLAVNNDKLKNYLLLFVSFSAGALLGDVFLHLLPETVEGTGLTLSMSFSALAGILVFFIIEKLLHWHHHHVADQEHEIHTLGYMNLFGDAVHNFIDGLVIAASYLVSVPLGIATTLAVIFHEIPQEIGDFGVLLHSGFSKSQALKFNFLSAIMAVVGAFVGLAGLQSQSQLLHSFLLPFTIGTFLYIAGSDLIPELHKHETANSIKQLIALIAGILVMYFLLFLEIA